MDFALIDSFRKIVVVKEVLDFVCQNSVESCRAVLAHVGDVGKKEGLTDYKLTQTPSVEDLTEDQVEFIRVTMDCFCCSPVWKRPELHSLLSSSLGGLRFFLVDRNHIDAVKHLLTSDNLLNFVVCDYISTHDYSSRIFSFLDDLEAFVVTSGGEFMASEDFLRNLPSKFYLKNEGGKVYFHFTELNENVLQELERLVSLTENIEDSLKETGHHCLCLVREIRLTTLDREFLSDILSRVIYPREITIILRGEKPAPILVDRMLSRINFTHNLRELSLEQLNLTADCASVIAHSLHQAPNLDSLSLSHNPLSSGVSKLFENLHHVPKLFCLMLINVQMGIQECCSLAASLQYVPQLKLLDLSWNPLSHGITELVNHLNTVPLLTGLWLRETQMGKEEAGALGRALRYIPQLKFLNLELNPFNCGVKVIMEHLSSVPNLEYLNLNETQIGEEEAGALGRALRYIPQLQRLDLDSNPLGRGVCRLIQALNCVPHLQTDLWLRNVQMTEQEVNELRRTAKETAFIKIYTDYGDGYRGLLLSTRH